MLAGLGGRLTSGAFIQPAGWLARNGWNIAKIAVPTIGGIAGGLALSEAIRPTATYQSGGAPIYFPPTQQTTSSDPMSSMMNMLPTMMMMMMMIPMMSNMSKMADQKKDSGD